MKLSILRKNFIRRLKCFLGKHFPVLATHLLMKRTLGYGLELEHPQTFNQKLQWLKLFVYSNNQRVSDCIDKFKVRDIVKEAGCDYALTKLYGVWDRAEDINWEELPERFVLKCNHGSDYNIICKDKHHFDKTAAIKTINEWMQENYGYENAELIYDTIKHKIICEEYIETEDGLPPKDYKIFCFYGEPKILFVAQDRFEGNTKFDYYDLNWNWIDVRNGHPNAAIHLQKPKFLEEMLNVAKILTKEFPLVRVDFYYEKGKLYFGELTFLHFAGLQRFDPEEYDYKFGALFPIDIKLLKRKRIINTEIHQ